MKPLRQKRLPKVLSHADCMRIINTIEHPVYRACVNVMYSCGLRLGEAVKIEVSHIDKSTSNLTVIGKYNRERLVPIPPTTLRVLRDVWKTHRNKKYLLPNRYHACRNRHCPACHRDQIQQWLEQRTAELLPCDYFHVTVTIPGTLRHVFRSNQKRMYSLLMRTASESLIQLADDPRHLGGRVGILTVLHTWASNLAYHPHVHMLVTGGGVDKDGRWVSCKDKYLVPVKALSKLIRGKFAARLRRSHKDLCCHIDPTTWSKDWVVHSLHYGQGESVVLNYLARYVFRIAITNHRIISMDQTHVTFRYKDRKGGRWVTSRIEGSEFIRRYLQHVLPKGFHKVRYYGIWHTSSLGLQRPPPARCWHA